MTQTTSKIMFDSTKPKFEDYTCIQSLCEGKELKGGTMIKSYATDHKAVINMLNEVLATELVCVLRYKRHYFIANGIHSESVKTEFLLHANEEMQLVDRIAKRIVELGGSPDFSPNGLNLHGHTAYEPADMLITMIKENLIAERIAIKSYREMISYLTNADPAIQRILKEILTMEENHADDLALLLESHQQSQQS